MQTRDEIIGALRGALEREDGVRAAWLGGADSNGRVDALSDIDVVTFIREGAADACIGAARRTLNEVGRVEREWRLPPPTWHGGDQVFFQLAGCPHYGLVDLDMAPIEENFEFLVVERHGEPRVLFDKDGLVKPTPFNRVAHAEKVRKRVESARGEFALLASLAEKEALRGRGVEAVHFYHGLVLRPLADVLRCVHCPDRFDFGRRYLFEDLPREAAEGYARLCYPKGPDEIPDLVARAREMMDGALSAWDAGGPARK